MHYMNKTRRYISLIVEVFLIFSIVLGVFAIFVKSVLLNKNTYTNLFNNNGTYVQVKESIDDRIDKILGTKNISDDIKESIVSEDDIKREADNAITGIIQYLQTGENNIVQINSEIYKQRINGVLNSILKDMISPYSNNLAFENNIKLDDVSYNKNKLQFNDVLLREKSIQFNNLIVTKDAEKNRNDMIFVEEVSTTNEAKSKIQSLLNEKGLTVDEARQKMIEKGISEEQALKILKGYGITVDENDIKSTENASGSQNQTPDGNSDRISEISENNGNEASQNTNNNDNNANGEAVLSGRLKEEIVGVMIANDGKSTEEKVNVIENKLSDKAGAIIDNEIQKINLSKITESDRFTKLVKIILLFSKMFWAFMILPIFLIILLGKINRWKLYSTLKYTGSAFLIAGILIFSAFFNSYLLKFFGKIDIDTIYIKDIVLEIIKYFLSVLSTSGIITFSLGAALLMPVIVNTIRNKQRN